MVTKKTKKNPEVTGRVMFTPDPEKAIVEFKDGDYGYNIPLEIKGAKKGDRYRVCLCYDARVLADGVFPDPDTGEWITDKSLALKRGDVVHVKASEYSKPKKKQFDPDGNELHYHNFWVGSPRQVSILSSEASRPRPKVTKPKARPRG